MNHEQIMKSVITSFLTAGRKNFVSTAKHLADLDLNILEDLAQNLQAGQHISERSEQEQLCYKVMNKLDLVAYRVNGSATSKKFMRNEIWSLIEYLGAPSWFITFAPADVSHPLCLYFADTQTKFKPQIRLDDAVDLAY
ncbi:hypothetical protein FIBSPDRAFT_967195 [Athelia psychrophila]|uniref:Helitron helicase-like domain-containing protein n=1 Tax=Athelia psychrophila TaxID=1759441 RepID=A0A167VZG6_9AGAM|nr:hypothetical protein FIBSPDRAFT_967195 [Fibularhizoctonia sp. CBS 109695]